MKRITPPKSTIGTSKLLAGGIFRGRGCGGVSSSAGFSMSSAAVTRSSVVDGEGSYPRPSKESYTSPLVPDLSPLSPTGSLESELFFYMAGESSRIEIFAADWQASGEMEDRREDFDFSLHVATAKTLPKANIAWTGVVLDSGDAVSFPVSYESSTANRSVLPKPLGNGTVECGVKCAIDFADEKRASLTSQSQIEELREKRRAVEKKMRLVNEQKAAARDEVRKKAASECSQKEKGSLAISTNIVSIPRSHNCNEDGLRNVTMGKTLKKQRSDLNEVSSAVKASADALAFKDSCVGFATQFKTVGCNHLPLVAESKNESDLKPNIASFVDAMKALNRAVCRQSKRAESLQKKVGVQQQIIKAWKAKYKALKEKNKLPLEIKQSVLNSSESAEDYKMTKLRLDEALERIQTMDEDAHKTADAILWLEEDVATKDLGMQRIECNLENSLCRVFELEMALARLQMNEEHRTRCTPASSSEEETEKLCVFQPDLNYCCREKGRTKEN